MLSNIFIGGLSFKCNTDSPQWKLAVLQGITVVVMETSALNSEKLFKKKLNMRQNSSVTNVCFHMTLVVICRPLFSKK